MNDNLTVFVCGTYRDLVDERKAVLEAILRLKYKHDSMEYFGARPDSPIETCLSEVRKSDVLVVIVGHLYGSLVPEQNISYSEAEYREGDRLGKPCLVYIIDENIKEVPKYKEDPDNKRRLDDFKKTLNKRHTARKFKDPNDLALSVATDLSGIAQDLEEKNNVLNGTIKLFNLSKEKQAKMLGEDVTPTFELFEKVHSGYKESFSQYREQILTSTDANWLRLLQDKLKRDNLFSGDMRDKLVRLSQSLETENDEVESPFVERICNYVMQVNLLKPLGQEIHPHHGQRWRQGYIKTLDHIVEEDWQMVLDPGGMAPPLTSGEINKKIKQIKKDYPVSRKIRKQDAVKRAVALWALDEVVQNMQNQYDEVYKAYLDLKSTLSK